MGYIPYIEKNTIQYDDTVFNYLTWNQKLF